MASAGLLKLLHSGIQDDRLIAAKGSLKMDDFQRVYVKAGRFTTEWYSVEFANTPAFGTTARCTIPRRGHLITRAFLMVTLPDIGARQLAAKREADSNAQAFLGPTFGWTNSLGNALVTSAQVTIGCNLIDVIDGRLMEVLDEFNTPLEKVTTVNRMIGRSDKGFQPGWDLETPLIKELAIPLPFWFHRGDPSEALPIDAISYDNVQISITFNNLQNLITSSVQCMNENGQYTYPVISGSPFFVYDVNGIPICTSNASNASSPPVAPTVTTMQASLTGGVCKGDYVNLSGAFQYTNTNGSGSGGASGSAAPGDRSLDIQSANILLEYVYLDGPEANRIRLGDLTYPILQHYGYNADTKGNSSLRIPFRIPNPTKDMYFYVHRNDAELLNAPFLATRDMNSPAKINGYTTTTSWTSAQLSVGSNASLPLNDTGLLFQTNDTIIVSDSTNPSQYFKAYVKSYTKQGNILNVHVANIYGSNTTFLTPPYKVKYSPESPWWPDAQGLGKNNFEPLIPAYSDADSEPIREFSLTYEGKIVRYATDVPALFQSILPAIEKRKTPWHNKYYYHIPFGTQGEEFGISNPMGHANLDKIMNVDLFLEFKPSRGSLRSTDIPSYTVYTWFETYNILRVYGGRAGLLFGY